MDLELQRAIREQRWREAVKIHIRLGQRFEAYELLKSRFVKDEKACREILDEYFPLCPVYEYFFREAIRRLQRDAEPRLYARTGILDFLLSNDPRIVTELTKDRVVSQFRDSQSAPRTTVDREFFLKVLSTPDLCRRIAMIHENEFYLKPYLSGFVLQPEQAQEMLNTMIALGQERAEKNHSSGFSMRSDIWLRFVDEHDVPVPREQYLEQQRAWPFESLHEGFPKSANPKLLFDDLTYTIHKRFTDGEALIQTWNPLAAQDYVLLVDVLLMKACNDRLGCGRTDKLLRRTGVALRKLSGGLCARVSGDSFAIFCQTSEAKQRADQVAAAFKEVASVAECRWQPTLVGADLLGDSTDPDAWDRLFVWLDELMFDARRADKSRLLTGL